MYNKIEQEYNQLSVSDDHNQVTVDKQYCDHTN